METMRMLNDNMSATMRFFMWLEDVSESPRFLTQVMLSALIAEGYSPVEVMDRLNFEEWEVIPLERVAQYLEDGVATKVVWSMFDADVVIVQTC